MQPLNNTFVEYIEGMRLFLESESDKDSPTLMEIRLHFSGFIARLIRSIPGRNRVKKTHAKYVHKIFYFFILMLYFWYLCFSISKTNRDKEWGGVGGGGGTQTGFHNLLNVSYDFEENNSQPV